MKLRRWLYVALFASGALGVAFVVAVGWLGSNQAVRPPWYQHRTPEQGLVPIDPAGADFTWQGGYRDPRADLGLDYETVELPAQDGSTLRGWLVPGDPGASAGVVAVHGGGADRREFLRHVPVLHGAGYPVLLFDCREQGISDGIGRGISLGFRESEDVSAAVAWAKRLRGLERVAVIGTSQGAASAIRPRESPSSSGSSREADTRRSSTARRRNGSAAWSASWRAGSAARRRAELVRSRAPVCSGLSATPCARSGPC